MSVQRDRNLIYLGKCTHEAQLESYQLEITSLRQLVKRLKETVSELNNFGSTLGQSVATQTDCSNAFTLNAVQESVKRNRDTLESPINPRVPLARTEEHGRILDLYLRCSEELRRTEAARKNIKAKADEYKAIASKWQLYVHSLDQLSRLPLKEQSTSDSRPVSAPAFTQKKDKSRKFPHFSNTSISKNDNYQSHSYLRPNPGTTVSNQENEVSTEESDESRSQPQQSKSPTLRFLHCTGEHGHVTIKAEKSDSDVPVVVSERPLNRKRIRNVSKGLSSSANRLISSDGSAKSLQIKEEQLSSSPVELGHNGGLLNSNGSMDLDEIEGTLQTPRKNLRKRKRTRDKESRAPNSMFDMLSIPSNQDNFLPQSGTDGASDHSSLGDFQSKGLLSIQEEASCRRKGEEYAALLMEQTICRRHELACAKRRQHNDRQIAEYRQDIGGTQVTDKHGLNTDGKTKSRNVGPLRPMDPNVILPRKDLLEKTCLRPLNCLDRSAADVPALAEDGEDYSANKNYGGPASKSKQKFNRLMITNVAGKQTLQSAEVHDRLNNLMSSTPPIKPHLPPAYSCQQRQVLATPSNISSIKTAANNKSTPQSRAIPSSFSINGKGSLLKSKQLSQSKLQYTTPFGKSKPDSSAKKAGSLRSKPLEELYVDDFKINPRHNQGYEHPFKEVVRKHEQRKCLPGCTKLDCCGGIFRKMAEAGGLRTYHKSRITASLPDDVAGAEEEEEQLLKDYLGNQHQTRLRGMSEEERAELLLQAKTKILAEHYGRHRQAYAREPSPFGYWEADMPDTQQFQELRQAADIRNRQKVGERYREAMRPDGVWKFRDE
ncbi:MAG: hypothetical protein LQ342_004707 [Letrouitia transgressa]|nr:MAG: hypothetical protein LQ342_004707 [Letrouitia transgressa]